MDMADDEPKKSEDVVLIGPPTPDGEGVHVLRAREERLEAGELRALREGKPDTGEIVTLEPRQENPRVCDVRSSYVPPALPSAKGTAKAASKKGPAQVATDAYRDHWEEIFGDVSARPPSRALN